MVETAAEVVNRVDEEMRAEMIECQAQLRRWTTEQKHIVDSLTLDAQRTLEGDRENLASKKEELSAALAAVDALRQSSEEERSRAEQLRQELEVLSSQEALLPAERAKLSKSLEGQRRARDPSRVVAEIESKSVDGAAAARGRDLGDLHLGSSPL